MLRVKKYYRNITALSPQDFQLPSYLYTELKMLFIVFLACLGASLVVLLVFTAKFYNETKDAYSRGLKTLSKIEEQLRENPNYPGLYISAANAAGRVGNQEKALFYAKKAVKLDPLSVAALDLKESLEK